MLKGTHWARTFTLLETAMSPRFFLIVPLMLTTAWLAGCGTTAESAATTSTPAPSAKSAASDMPFPTLEKGATAEVIRQKLGKPLEIQPMPSPEGKAEVWIYKYDKSLGMVQVAGGTVGREVMSPSMSGVGTTTVQEPVFTMAEKIEHITLSLLLFDGRLQVQKAAVEDTIEHR
jgi:hypothetical protein